MEYYQSMADALNKLKEQGYTEDFNFKEGNLTGQSADKKYAQQDLKIVGIHRFEGDSNPDDMAIVYVVEASDGTKGTIIDAFGTYQDADLANFMKRVEDSHKTNYELGDAEKKSR